MDCGTKERGLGLALVLAIAPACAGGVGFGDEAATEQTAGTTMGTGTAPTTQGPSGPDSSSTSGDDATTATTEALTGETTSSGESSSTGDDTTTGDDLPHPELYPVDRIHSPITGYVADQIRKIAEAPAGADKSPLVFAKIGSGTTASVNYMQCFSADADIQDLPADPNLAATIAHFRMGTLADMTTSFNRASAAAMAGWAADALVTGMPTPVIVELETIKPRFAHVLIGTHDLDKDQPAQLWVYAEELLDMVDALTINGVVPILSTLPRRTDLPAKDVFVPRYNQVIRAVAQGRQIPLVDLELALAALPMQGLLDGLDLTVFNSAMVDRPCFFSESALMFGYNVRNLESLVALDRARQVVVDAVPELDPAGPRLQGSGTGADPVVIPSLPFVDLRSTADSPSDVVDSYGGACDALKDESGPEVFYRLTVEAQINVRVMVFDRSGVDVDVHVLSDEGPETCLKRNDLEVAGSLPPGTYYIAIDSYAGDMPEGAAGEYALVVMAD